MPSTKCRATFSAESVVVCSYKTPTIVLRLPRGHLQDAFKNKGLIIVHCKCQFLLSSLQTRTSEELYYPDDALPLYLDKKSETLKIIQHLRDEAHRFGITRHRNLRSKKSIGTELTHIKGIGEATSKHLLSVFKSVKNLKLQTFEALSKEVGVAKAKILKEAL